ncbi:MAG: hypothetical protein A3F91_08510 [Flavobacteria bacterium RIFCSPLOWO2_12_FULL_35_11]|nr:MAG: hypothetical protein A3F91_08510 [Flavobacteria bacterium RIFCSPLOWO2_12_FULL_35_11]
MNTHSTKFKVRLGLFVAAGFIIFAIAIFLIGRQKNLFNPVFSLSTTFYNVSGLQVGNNIRFSGINVGTVDNIRIINDSTVIVNMVVQKDVQKFIKTDCMAAIGSEGIIGDRILIITQGSAETKSVKSGQFIASIEPVETDAIIASLGVTAQNAEVISGQVIEILYDINQGKGTLGMLIQDSTMAESLNKTMGNLQKSSKGLKENMEAAKSNFLLKGYFKKKEREAAKNKEEAAEAKKE